MVCRTLACVHDVVICVIIMALSPNCLRSPQVQSASSFSLAFLATTTCAFGSIRDSDTALSNSVHSEPQTPHLHAAPLLTQTTYCCLCTIQCPDPPPPLPCPAPPRCILADSHAVPCPAPYLLVPSLTRSLDVSA